MTILSSHEGEYQDIGIRECNYPEHGGSNFLQNGTHLPKQTAVTFHNTAIFLRLVHQWQKKNPPLFYWHFTFFRSMSALLKIISAVSTICIDSPNMLLKKRIYRSLDTRLPTPSLGEQQTSEIHFHSQFARQLLILCTHPVAWTKNLILMLPTPLRFWHLNDNKFSPGQLIFVLLFMKTTCFGNAQAIIWLYSKLTDSINTTCIQLIYCKIKCELHLWQFHICDTLKSL